MKTLKIIISKGMDDFGAYAEEVPFIFASGETVAEVKENVLQAIELYKEYNEELPEILKEEFKIEYKMDVASLLEHYKGFFSLASLERITHINQRQLQHYSTGLRKPRPEQARKIEASLHRLGEELLSIQL
jgi:predicted RNase H-like HicB family nuclease